MTVVPEEELCTTFPCQHLEMVAGPGLWRQEKLPRHQVSLWPKRGKNGPHDREREQLIYQHPDVLPLEKGAVTCLLLCPCIVFMTWVSSEMGADCHWGLSIDCMAQGN